MPIRGRLLLAEAAAQAPSLTGCTQSQAANRCSYTGRSRSSSKASTAFRFLASGFSQGSIAASGSGMMQRSWPAAATSGGGSSSAHTTLGSRSPRRWSARRETCSGWACQSCSPSSMCALMNSRGVLPAGLSGALLAGLVALGTPPAPTPQAPTAAQAGAWAVPAEALNAEVR